MAVSLKTAVRFFNPAGPDRCARVMIEPAADRAFLVIQIERGVKATLLKHHETLGPYTPEQVQAAFNEAVADLRGQGYLPAGLEALLRGLEHEDSVVR